MNYSLEQRRKASEQLLVLENKNFCSGSRYTVANDLMCRLNELEEVLRGVEQRFSVVGAWQGSIPCADVPVECNADEVRAVLNNSSLILPSTSGVAAK